MSTIKIKKADGSIITRKKQDWQRNIDNWTSRGWTVVDEASAPKVEKPLVLTEEVKPAKKKKKSKK